MKNWELYLTGDTDAFMYPKPIGDQYCAYLHVN